MPEDDKSSAEKFTTSRPAFHAVPSEIFYEIIRHLYAVKDLASLSQTCHRFKGFSDADGWRIFAQTKFPSLTSELPLGIDGRSADWKKLALCLTSQSRAWDKRSISSTIVSNWEYRLRLGKSTSEPYLQLDGKSVLHRWDRATSTTSPVILNRGVSEQNSRERSTGRHPRGQTALFHPVIDTTLEFSGNLSSKKHILAWSTGAGISIRIRRSGSLMPRRLDDPYDKWPEIDWCGNKINWFTIQPHEFLSGLDDVTAIKLVEPSAPIRPSAGNTLVVDLIVGRASGHLHRYSVANAEPWRVIANTFHSNEVEGSPLRRGVRSADVSSKSANPLLVASSDKVLSLYDTDAENHDVFPIAELEVELETSQSRVWTTKFSSPEKLLVGLGKSSNPLHNYQVTPTGLVLTQKFAENYNRAAHSVYAIEPLSGASRAGGSSNGDVFLSGWYDGDCRLYDLRAGHGPVMTYHDPIDEDFAVYSLIAFGQERFLAGTATHIIKLFDFRNGSKVYQHTDGLSCSEREPLPAPPGGDATQHPELPGNSDLCRYDIPGSPPQICNFHRLSQLDKYRPNSNMFLSGRNSNRNVLTAGSPVFSLSSPHPLCPVLYAGTAGKVTELEVAEFNLKGNVLDPWFAAPPRAAPETATHTSILTMYETDDGRSPRLGSGVRDTPSKLWWNGRDRFGAVDRQEVTSWTRLDSRWQD